MASAYSANQPNSPRSAQQRVSEPPAACVPPFPPRASSERARPLQPRRRTCARDDARLIDEKIRWLWTRIVEASLAGSAIDISTGPQALSHVRVQAKSVAEREKQSMGSAREGLRTARATVGLGGSGGRGSPPLCRRCRRCRRTLRCGARKGDGGGAPPGSDLAGEKFGRRRALAVLEAAAEAAAACAFEVAGRPKGLPLSLLPQRAPPALLERAEASVREGERLLEEEGDAAGAALEFSGAIELAPEKYKLVQRARLGRMKAYGQLGSSAGEDFRSAWLWGRGVRWPGWYIIGYILLRRAFVAPETEGQESAAPKPAQKGIPSEWFLVILLAALYNYLLLTYGLEY